MTTLILKTVKTDPHTGQARQSDVVAVNAAAVELKENKDGTTQVITRGSCHATLKTPFKGVVEKISKAADTDTLDLRKDCKTAKEINKGGTAFKKYFSF